MKNPPVPFVSLDAFRESAKAAGPDAQLVDARVRQSFDTEVKASDEQGSRNLLFTISTANTDRQNDTIALEGWDLGNYRKNPVVLFGHDSSSPPLAKSTKIWPEAGKLKSDAEFVPADNPAVGRFAEGIFQLYKGGFMSATSVGFAPRKYSYRDDPGGGWGIDFLEQELLEFSLVPIPANAEALIEGRSAGHDVTGVLDFYEDQIRRHLGAERLIKLAESVLGKDGKDTVALSWAKGIVEGHGLTLMDPQRVENIERAARAKRLDEQRQRRLNLLKLGPRA